MYSRKWYLALPKLWTFVYTLAHSTLEMLKDELYARSGSVQCPDNHIQCIRPCIVWTLYSVRSWPHLLFYLLWIIWNMYYWRRHSFQFTYFSSRWCLSIRYEFGCRKEQYLSNFWANFNPSIDNMSILRIRF